MLFEHFHWWRDAVVFARERSGWSGVVDAPISVSTLPFTAVTISDIHSDMKLFPFLLYILSLAAVSAQLKLPSLESGNLFHWTRLAGFPIPLAHHCTRHSSNTVKNSILETTTQVSTTLKQVFGGSSSDSKEADPVSVAPALVENIETKPSPAQISPTIPATPHLAAASVLSSPKPSPTPVPSKTPPPPRAPSLIVPKNLKLPSPVAGLELSCASALEGFSNRQKPCLAPFFSTRPDSVLGANMMARTAVSCLCGSPYSTSDSYLGYIMDTSNNCTLDLLPAMTRDKMNVIYESCHADPMRRDSSRIIQTLNLTAYLSNGEAYQPLSVEDSIAKSTGTSIMVSRTAISPYAWIGLQGILWILLWKAHPSNLDFQFF